LHSQKKIVFLQGKIERKQKIKRMAREIMATTREQALTRFQRAKLRKRECIDRLEKTMKVAYEKRTGKTADYFFAL
jgi:hypothetical protein